MHAELATSNAHDQGEPNGLDGFWKVKKRQGKNQSFWIRLMTMIKFVTRI